MYLVKLKIFLIKFCSKFYFSRRSKVIFYHDIHSEKKYSSMSTSLDLFKQHITIIKNEGYEIVSEIKSKYGQIEICFDDGFLGLYDNINFINKNNIPIHLFIITSCFDIENFINKDKLIELSKYNNLKISSHTHSHSDFINFTDNQIETDFKQSKNILEKIIGKSVNSLCYPLGYHNNKTNNIANKIGFKNLYSCIPGFFKLDNCKIINRSLVQFAAKDEFTAIIKGGDHILSTWYKFKHFK